MISDMQIPKTKANDLVDRINEVVRRPVIDRLEIKRIQREAEVISRLSSPEKEQGYAILGMLAALDYDIAGVRKNYEIALRVSSSDSHGWIYINFVTSISRCKRPHEAYELACEVLDRYPDDKDVVRLCTGVAIAGCRFSSIDRLQAHMRKLGKH